MLSKSRNAACPALGVYNFSRGFCILGLGTSEVYATPKLLFIKLSEPVLGFNRWIMLGDRGECFNDIVTVFRCHYQCNENSPEQAPGYLKDGWPKSQLSQVSPPERAENAKTGNGASTGE